MLVAALVPLSPRQLSLWGSPTRYVAWINRTTSRPGGWSPRPAWGGRGGSLGPRRGRGPQPSPTGRPHRIVPAEETLPRRLPPPAERSSERRVASRPVLSCPVPPHLPPAAGPPPLPPPSRWPRPGSGRSRRGEGSGPWRRRQRSGSWSCCGRSGRPRSPRAGTAGPAAGGNLTGSPL